MKLIINEYLSKNDQYLVHYIGISCHAVIHTVYLNFCSGHILKSLGLKIMPRLYHCCS